jgi:hypothetical protein
VSAEAIEQEEERATKKESVPPTLDYGVLAAGSKDQA